MSTENLTSSVTILGSSFLVSFLMGYVFKKIIKLLVFLVGGILALLIYLHSQQIISVDTSKIEDLSEGIINSISNQTSQ
jgi:uncharacterized membrane protein (Fun14 family)